MPKKTVGFCGIIAVTLNTTPIHAATTCDPGYYLDGDTCRDCGSGYYCPGGTTPRQDCLNTVPAHDLGPYIINFSARSVVEGVWYHNNAWDPSHCLCNWDLWDETRTRIFIQERCTKGPHGTQHTQYDWCRTGYYATNPIMFGNYYTACAPCDNAPANAHYTSYSTPSEMYAVESNCPWACDAGYGRVGDACVPLCTAGVTKIHVGAAVAPLFPVKYTTPSLVVRTAGGLCYGNLTPGNGPGINIRIGDTTYHLP